MTAEAAEIGVVADGAARCRLSPARCPRPAEPRSPRTTSEAARRRPPRLPASAEPAWPPPPSSAWATCSTTWTGTPWQVSPSARLRRSEAAKRGPGLLLPSPLFLSLARSLSRLLLSSPSRRLSVRLPSPPKPRLPLPAPAGLLDPRVSSAYLPVFPAPPLSPLSPAPFPLSARTALSAERRRVF